MSEETAVPTAAPEAPAPAQADVPAETPRPQTAREARQAIRTGKMSRPQPAAEPVTTESAPTKPNRAGQPQPMTADGKYAPKPEAAEEGVPDEATPPAAEAADVEEAEAETAPEAVQTDRIALPDDHPLRERGRQFFDELSPEEIRSLINTPLRRRELEEAQKEAAELRRQLAEQKARAEVYSDPTSDPLQNPDVKGVYDDLLRAYGPEAANAYLKGQDTRSQKVSERAQAEMQQAEMAAASQRFAVEVWPRAANLFQGWTTPGADPATDYKLRQKIAPHLQRFGAMVDAGVARPDVGEFLDNLMSAYAADPEIQQWARTKAEKDREAERAKIAEEVRAERERAEKEQIAAQAEARRRNPLGRMGPAQNRQAVTIDGAPQTAAEARKNLRSRAYPGR